MGELFTGKLKRDVLVKAVSKSLVCILLPALWLCAGCESSPTPPPPSPSQPMETVDSNNVDVVVTQPAAEPVSSLPGGFGPSRIEVLPLTELVQAPESAQRTQLNVYVSLLDAFGSQIKAPGTLRFELYDYVQRSAAPKGQRIAIWPDIDLTRPDENHSHWQDFLRAYAFELGTEAARDRAYILEVTFIAPSSRRISVDFMLRPDN